MWRSGIVAAAAEESRGHARQFAKPEKAAGETVFDPCAGMGTTLLAAELLGREAFGLEREADVARAADGRVWDALHGEHALTERDEERACRWILETREEAQRVPAPRAANGSDVKTWERAQRRLADVERLIEYGSR